MKCALQSNIVTEGQVLGSIADYIEPQAVITSPFGGVAECNTNVLVIRPSSVYLNLEDLKCFEVVEHQFHHYGIKFKNAIALQPSNPAYPPRSGTNVIMGAPKTGWLEATFSQPIRQFCCYVTSSQRMILSAYDSEDNLIARSSMISSNLAGSDSPISPNAQMKIQGLNISRITFYAFDGQLTITDLSFSF